MVYIIVISSAIFVLVLMFVQGYLSSKKYEENILAKAKENYGKRIKREYSPDDLERIKNFFETYKKEDSVDDITANDLDLDKVYMTFNNSFSAAGDDYFYYRLRTPENTDNIEEKLSYIDEHEDVRDYLVKFFYRIGRIRKISFIDFMGLIEENPAKKSLKEYVSFALVFIAIALLFIDTTIGIVSLIAVLVYNIITYYKERGNIEAYVIGVTYITNFIDKCSKLKNEKDTPIEEDIELIKSKASELRKITKHYALVFSSARQTGAGNPFDILLDYLRMILHIDIIQFNRMLNSMSARTEDIKELYFKTGELESFINICSMRKAMNGYCIPDFSKKAGITASGIYHPLLTEPVKNDIDETGNVLITGSNASGKSTFLKAVAINLIFAKTINTCAADSFSTADYTVFSSMSLRDDITRGDSYFMAEIKAFKRIIDYAEAHKDKKIAAFTDELLRGTNTIERISACTSILKYLNDNNVYTFSATHDIELTDLLADCYENYHFDEDFIDDDVCFNYKLKKGKATSKNAIKLLHVMGFSDEVIYNATNTADMFLKQGKWV